MPQTCAYLIERHIKTKSSLLCSIAKSRRCGECPKHFFIWRIRNSQKLFVNSIDNNLLRKVLFQMAATLCLPIFEQFSSLLFWRKYLSDGFLLFLDSNFKPTGLAVPKLIKWVMKTCFPRNIKLFLWNSAKDIHKTDLFVMLDMLLLSSITISLVKTK